MPIAFIGQLQFEPNILTRFRIPMCTIRSVSVKQFDRDPIKMGSGSA